MGIVLSAMLGAFLATLALLQASGRGSLTPVALADAPTGAARRDGGEPVDTRFALCREDARTCVVDGDTIRYRGRRIRILGIDTPELHPARCAREERLGLAAKARLQTLVNAGPFQLVTGDRDRDAYGRELRWLRRGQRDLGEQLIGEGLARPYGSGRRSWC